MSATDPAFLQQATEAQYLAALVQSSHDAIIGLDLQRLVTSWNTGAENLFGYTAAEMLGTPIKRLIPPDRLAEEDDLLARIQRGERLTHYETERTHQTGQTLAVSITLSPIRDAAGRIIGASKVVRDISAQQQAEQQLAYQAQLLDSIHDAIVATNGQLVITYWNLAAEALFGWTPAEALGQSARTLLVSQLSEAESARLLAAAQQTGRYEGELRFRHKHGQLIVAQVRTTVLRGPAGQFTGVISTYQDVTHRRQAEELSRLLFESAPSAMLLVDADGGIQLANHRAEELFGYPPHELLARGVEDLLPERYRPQHPADRRAFLHAPAMRSMGHGRDLFGLRRDGQEVPLEVGLNTIETPSGLVTLASIIDLTERKRTEAELRQQAEELRRSNQDLEAFAYAASHDLQEPLRAIAGPLQLLQLRYHDQLDAQAQAYIANSVDGAERMRQLINDLLTYARVDRRGGPPQPSSSAAAVLRALANLDATITESGAEITRDTLPTVAADAAQLVMLFQNLLGNALKFRGSAPPRIHIGAEQQGRWWQFTVQDNGIGIAPQHREQIFGLFQRLHSRRAYPGTGIGLALCQRIVERHGGRIWVESVIGQGSTFCFTLPAYSDAPPAAGEVLHASSTQSAGH